jgi:DNA-binding XRE family transcriptional regulator
MEHISADDLIYIELGKRLREARAKSPRRLTQDQLASLVGLERTSITNIEKGRQKPPIHVIYAMCKALGVEVSEVFPLTSDLASLARQDVVVRLGDQSRSLPRSVAAIVRRFETAPN